MGLISRVSSRTYRSQSKKIKKWVVVQLDAIVIVKTNHTLNPGSTVVFQIQRSESTIWVTKLVQLCLSQFMLSWYPMNTNKSVPKLSKLLVFLPTNTWPRPAVKNPSISVSEPIHTTSHVSIKCCHVLVQIDFKLVREVLMVNQMV